MIELTRLTGSKLFINPDQIWLVESTPDTVITMINNERLMVKETCTEVAEKFLHFKMSIINKNI